jgi:hypothetical protein
LIKNGSDLKRGFYSLVFITGIVITTGRCVFSQSATDSIIDKSNIESFSDKLSIYSYGISKFNNFEISANGNQHKVRYNPNENLNLGLGFNYKWLGVGLSYDFGFLNSDQDLYGESKSLDLQMDVFSKQVLYSGNFQYYQGYYWQNPDEFMHNWNASDSVQIRSDIKTVTFGLNGTYVFNNDKFSFKAAFQNTERQLSSAGSWLLSGKLSVYSISADSSLVPFDVQELYPNAKDIKGLSVINLGSAGGYTYTYVLGDYFYFNAALMMGLNLQMVSRINLSNENIGGETKISSNAQFRLAIGCNKPKVFYGFSATFDSYSIRNSEESYFNYNYGRIRFFYGRRFNVAR